MNVELRPLKEATDFCLFTNGHVVIIVNCTLIKSESFPVKSLQGEMTRSSAKFLKEVTNVCSH